MTTPDSLRLRPLKPSDEAEFRVGHEAMRADDFSFGLGLEDAGSWQQYLEDLNDCRLGRNLPPGRVPATLLVADVDGSIVGRTSIRHELNESLEQHGGHIGYGVLPEHRRHGYATEVLRQSLVVARSLGVGQALVTCDDDNIGSITVIERCGGKLENLVPRTPPQPAIRRYWID
ncbi:MAG TPA: GNAT family N-acetyltransferase [Streptosporangiaceae bacterium]|jgi:predicted acetyltransferase